MCLCIFLPRSSPCVTQVGFVHYLADVLVLLGSGRTWNGKIITEVTLELNKMLD